MQEVLIAGGKTGIGRATVDHLAAQGWRVHLAGRGEPPAGLPAGVQWHSWDDLDQAPALPAIETLAGAVYLPGSITLRPFHRTTTEEFLEDYRINVLGAVRFLQAALPSLRRSGSASVVLFSSVAASVGMGFHASIASAKAAVEGLGRSLAAEWAPAIRVNVIAPSLTDTPLARALVDSGAKREAAAGRHPLKRIGSPEETAGLVAYLLSGSSGFMTGQVLRPDGGLSSLRLF